MKRIVLWGLGFLLVFSVASARAQGPGGPNFQGTINFFLNTGVGTELGGTVGVVEATNVGTDDETPRHFVVDPAGLPLLLSPNGSPGVGIGLGTPSAPFHVQNNSETSDPTIHVENATLNQDVLIAFLGNVNDPGAGAFVGSLGVILDDPNPRFVIRGGPDLVALNLALAEDGGNVGIRTATPQSALQVIGYTQLDLTSDAPPGGDCDEAAERGRMIVDNAAGLLYVCVDSGWVAK